MEVDMNELEKPKVGKKETKSKRKNPPPPPPRRSIMKPPPQIQLNTNIFDENKFAGEVPLEMKRNIKPIIFRAMAMPARQDAGVLNVKLCCSTFMNRYLDHYLMLENLAFLNDHLKFGLCYASNFLESKFIKNNLNNNNEQHQQQ